MGYKGKSNIEYQKEYYYKNREQRLLKMRQYNKNNYDTIQEYKNFWYEYNFRIVRKIMNTLGKDQIVLFPN